MQSWGTASKKKFPGCGPACTAYLSPRTLSYYTAIIQISCLLSVQTQVPALGMGAHTGAPLQTGSRLAGRRLDHAGTLVGLQSNSGAVASRPHSQTYFRSSILPLQ